MDCLTVVNDAYTESDLKRIEGDFISMLGGRVFI